MVPGSRARRLRLGVPVAIVAGMLLALGAISAASAATTVQFKATFTEPIGGPVNSPFSCPPNDSCGSGEVVGLGRASDVIVFGGPGGPGFDVRTITLADGSALVSEETGSNPSIPGQSYHSVQSYGNPFHLDLTDVVDGGLSTGLLAGASGMLTGSVSLAGGMAIITLAGTITLAS